MLWYTLFGPEDFLLGGGGGAFKLYIFKKYISELFENSLISHFLVLKTETEFSFYLLILIFYFYF